MKIQPNRSGNFVKLGWEVLHATVLANGCERQVPMYDETGVTAALVVEVDLYRLILGPVLVGAGIKLTGKYVNADEIMHSVWSGLRQALRSYDPNLWDALAAPRATSALIAGYVDWAHLHQSEILEGFDPKVPGSVAKYAFELIHTTSDSSSAGLPLLGWCIALIGWVDTIYRNLKPCRFCCRWAQPPGQLCFEHTQAGRGTVGSQSEKYVRYRTAKLLAEAEQEKVGVGFAPFSHLIFKRRLIGQLMINSALSDEGRSMIHSALLACPAVLKMLGGKKVIGFASSELMALLQKKLDPIEISVEGFFLKIMLAERWYVAQRRALPGKRGRGKQSQERMTVAISLAAQGLSDSEIAAQLGVARSAVSNWKRRNPDFLRETKRMGRC